jgi:hypothetical protein
MSTFDILEKFFSSFCCPQVCRQNFDEKKSVETPTGGLNVNKQTNRRTDKQTKTLINQIISEN